VNFDYREEFVFSVWLPIDLPILLLLHQGHVIDLHVPSHHPLVLLILTLLVSLLVILLVRAPLSLLLKLPHVIRSLTL
jgi:hypothetical protein